MMSTQPCPDKGAEAELLPCPFCGGDSVSVHDSYVDNQGFMVLCASCTAEGPLCTSVKDAAAEWNRRSMPAAVAEELLRVGGLMSNVMFNLAQRSDTGVVSPVTLKKLQEDWDAARSTFAADRQARASVPAAGAVQQLAGQDRVLHRLLVDFGAARFHDVQTTRERVYAHIDRREAGLRAQLASERQAKEYEQRHAAESESALAKAHAQLARQSQGEPDGWKLVPVKLTEDMHIAAVRAIIRATGNADCPPSVWAAMLGAAPAPGNTAQPAPHALDDDKKGGAS